MIAQSYDKVPENDSILLDLPFREGSGTGTFDHAKPHHPMAMNDPGGGSFVWTTLASGIMVLEFTTIGGGGTDGVYLDSPAAETADLDFTTGDFSLGCWIKWDSTGGWSEIIMGRYGVDLDGWEVYLDISGGRNTVSQRHHHVSLTPNENSNCYSIGWAPGAWCLLGISRKGSSLYPKHYRNGVELGVTYEASGMLAPDTCNRDLTIGCRYTKDANYFSNMRGRIIISGKALSASEWLSMYKHQARWYA